MPKREPDRLIALKVNLPRSDLSAMANLSGIDRDKIGDQIRKAVKQYVKQRSSELKTRNILMF